jgi:hypothetical protein
MVSLVVGGEATNWNYVKAWLHGLQVSGLQVGCKRRGCNVVRRKFRKDPVADLPRIVESPLANYTLTRLPLPVWTRKTLLQMALAPQWTRKSLAAELPKPWANHHVAKHRAKPRCYCSSMSKACPCLVDAAYYWWFAAVVKTMLPRTSLL